MKKMGELMAELGFNKNAPQSVKEAYIKHLIKASTGVHVATPSEKIEVEKNPTAVLPMKTSTPQQLSFDFLSENPLPKPSKKAVS